MLKPLPVIIFCLLTNPGNANESKTLASLKENRSCVGCNLSKLNLGLQDLQSVDLRGANLRYSYLVNVDLSNANLSNSDLSKTYMNGANLSATKLVETDFEGAELELANFAKQFSLMNLVGAYLLHASISEEQLNNAKLCKTVLPDASTSYQIVRTKTMKMIKS